MLGLYGGSVWLAVERKQTRVDVNKWPFSCQNISVVFLVLIVLNMIRILFVVLIVTTLFSGYSSRRLAIQATLSLISSQIISMHEERDVGFAEKA